MPPLVGQPRPDRLVSHHPLPVADRGHEGIHPVEITILATVLDHAHPRLPGLERCPQIGKGCRRHIRVAYDVVTAAEEFVDGKTAYSYEFIIDRCDPSLQIGGGNNRGSLRKLMPDIGDRQIFLHAFPPLKPFSRARRLSNTRAVCCVIGLSHAHLKIDDFATRRRAQAKHAEPGGCRPPDDTHPSQ